jgi:hypothetical protein
MLPHWPSDQVTIQGSPFAAIRWAGSDVRRRLSRSRVRAAVSDAAWMESYPVQVAVKLTHDANGDNCKALLSRVLRSTFRRSGGVRCSYQATSGIMKLNIRGTTASEVTW